MAQPHQQTDLCPVGPGPSQYGQISRTDLWTKSLFKPFKETSYVVGQKARASINNWFLKVRNRELGLAEERHHHCI